MGIGSFFGELGLFIGLVLALVFVGGSYWFSDKIAVKAAGAGRSPRPRRRSSTRSVRDLTQRAGLPMPAIYISPAQQPNAFATGRNPDHAAVAVTQGLLQIVDQDELRGVLAHELSHVHNRDILISRSPRPSRSAITFLARMLMWGAMFGGGGGRDREAATSSVPRHDDPRPDRRGAAPDGALPLARVRGRPQRRRAPRRRRAARPGAGEDRRLREAGPDERRPRAGDGLHHQPADRPKMQLRQPLQTHPPTEERIRRLRSTSYTASDAPIEIILLGTGSPLPTTTGRARPRSCARGARRCSSMRVGRSACGCPRPACCRSCSTRCC